MQTFEKLSDDFHVNVNIKEILEKFSKNDDTSIYERLPIIPPARKLVWQSYPSDIQFARNFHIVFPELCTAVVNKLRCIQLMLARSSNPSLLCKVFLSTNFRNSNVNLIHTFGAVKPHVDITRHYSISIGITDTISTTHVSRSTNMHDANNAEYDDYCVKRGELYITNVKHVHWVSSNSTADRYILTYNIL